MNVIISSGFWRNDTRGAYVQLMFPAIYKLSCKMNVRFFPCRLFCNFGNIFMRSRHLRMFNFE